jgi:hypothetical protein
MLMRNEKIGEYIMDPKCFGVIPGTFIACGEDGNFCSDYCMDRAMYIFNQVYDIKSPDGTSHDDIPIGLRRITEAEVANSNFLRRVPCLVENRHIIVRNLNDLTHGDSASKDHAHISIQIYWYSDGRGVALERDSFGGKINYYACGIL